MGDIGEIVPERHSIAIGLKQKPRFLSSSTVLGDWVVPASPLAVWMHQV